MRITSVFLYVLVASSICGAFFAGRYIGWYDSEQVHAQAMKIEYASSSADRLRIISSAIALLRDSKIADATRVLDQYAKLGVDSVAECLQAPQCAAWIAPTAESRETLQRYVAASKGAPADHLMISR